jgi:hypothetical protein
MSLVFCFVFRCPLRPPRHLSHLDTKLEHMEQHQALSQAGRLRFSEGLPNKNRRTPPVHLLNPRPIHPLLFSTFLGVRYSV